MFIGEGLGALPVVRVQAAGYAVAENGARATGTGLWHDLGTSSGPVPPRDWRKASAADSVHR